MIDFKASRRLRFRRFRSTPRFLVAAILSLALVAAGCAGGGEESGDGDSPTAGAGTEDSGTEASTDAESVQLDVGYIPIVTAVMPVEIGRDRGYFEEEGLEVEPHTASGGAALIPALVSGQYEFVFANNFSILAAASEGLDIRIVSSANNSSVDPDPIEEALVSYDDISELSDLQGKRVAVNTLNNIVHLANLVALEEAGVDPDTVEFVEVPFPDMPVALREGRVDAIDVAEPFKTDILQDENTHILATPFRAVDDNMVVSSWVTTGEFLAENPDVVERFARALDKAKAYGNENPEELRSLVIERMGIDEEIVADMVIAEMTTGQPSQEQLEIIAGHAVRFGFISEAPDVSKILSLEP